MPTPDPSAFDDIRRERRDRAAQQSPGGAPTIALVADIPDEKLLTALAGSGWSVGGLLAADVFDGLLWAARTPSVTRNYVELAELLWDPDAEAACVAVDAAAAVTTVPALLHAGLHVLLPSPVAMSSAAIRIALEAAEVAESEHAVTFETRWWPSARELTRLLADGSVGPVAQATVRGWPSGVTATAELIDVTTNWCGEIVAVCGAPEQLPAAELPDGASVRWALLTDRGVTVLVSHEGSADPAIRLSTPQGRLEVTETAVRPLDGEPWPAGDATASAFEETARRLADAVARDDALPETATLRTLFVAARVREALAASASERRWIETA